MGSPRGLPRGEGPPRQGLRGPAEALLRLIKSPYSELFERGPGDRFPLFLRAWCPEGVPSLFACVLNQEKVSRVKGVPDQKSAQQTERTVLLVYRPETVEKVAKPLFRVRLHEIFASISCEIVGKNFARSVISEAHVPGNDVIEFYSVVCGRRNSLQEGFFDKLRTVLLVYRPLDFYWLLSFAV